MFFKDGNHVSPSPESMVRGLRLWNTAVFMHSCEVLHCSVASKHAPCQDILFEYMPSIFTVCVLTLIVNGGISRHEFQMSCTINICESSKHNFACRSLILVNLCDGIPLTTFHPPWHFCQESVTLMFISQLANVSIHLHSLMWKPDLFTVASWDKWRLFLVILWVLFQWALLVALPGILLYCMSSRLACPRFAFWTCPSQCWVVLIYTNHPHKELCTSWYYSAFCVCRFLFVCIINFSHFVYSFVAV